MVLGGLDALPEFVTVFDFLRQVIVLLDNIQAPQMPENILVSSDVSRSNNNSRVNRSRRSGASSARNCFFPPRRHSQRDQVQSLLERAQRLILQHYSRTDFEFSKCKDNLKMFHLFGAVLSVPGAGFTNIGAYAQEEKIEALEILAPITIVISLLLIATLLYFHMSADLLLNDAKEVTKNYKNIQANSGDLEANRFTELPPDEKSPLISKTMKESKKEKNGKKESV